MLGFDSPKPLVLLLLATLLIGFMGGSQQMTEELRWIIAVAGAMSTVYVPAFVWNLLKAPERMEAQQALAQQAIEEERDQLQAPLNDKQQRPASLDFLGILLQRGSDLFHLSVKSESDFQQ